MDKEKIDEENFLENFNYFIDNLEQELSFLIDEVTFYKKKFNDLSLFKISQIEVKKKEEKEKIIELLSSFENKIKISLNKIYNLIYEIEAFLDSLKKRDILLFYFFNCYFYKQEKVLFVFKREKNILGLIDEFKKFIEKSIETLENLINQALDCLDNEKPEDFKKMIKILEFIEKIARNEMDHIVTIKSNVEELKLNLNRIKVNDLIFSEESIVSIKDVIGKRGDIKKFLATLIKNLVVEGTENKQIEPFRNYNNITLAKYPRGHRNLRIILNFNEFEKGNIFILDIVTHDRKYEIWHEDEVPQKAFEVALELSKYHLAFLFNERCQELLAEILANKEILKELNY